MSSHVVLPSAASFVSCLSTPCYSQYSASTFSNVSLHNFASNKDGSYRLFIGDTTMAAQGTGNEAVMVDTTYAYGGYPEDLAVAASKLGYQFLVLQDHGDDDFICYFMIAKWAKRSCPIPIFWVSMDHAPMFVNASLITLKNEPLDPVVNARAKAMVGISAFAAIFLGGFPLLFISVLRLMLLKAHKNFNAGTALGWLGFMECPFLLVPAFHELGLSISFHNQLLSYKTNVIFQSFALEISVLATFIVAMEFKAALKTITNEAVVKNIYLTPLGVCGNLAIAFYWIGSIVCGVLLSQNSRLSSVNAFFVIGMVASLIFRFLVGGYFLWGYCHVLKVFRDVSTNSKKSVHMARRLIWIVLSTIMVLISGGILSVSKITFSIYGAAFFLPLARLAYAWLAISEVVALPQETLMQQMRTVLKEYGLSVGPKTVKDSNEVPKPLTAPVAPSVPTEVNAL